MSAAIFTFLLADAAGTQHLYEVMPHNAEEGFAISAQLVELGAPVLLAALAPLLSAGGGEDGTVGGLMERDAGEILRQLPIAEIGARLGPIVAALPKMREQLLRHAARDGVKFVSKGAFNTAYQGNYAELYMALFRIVLGNGFLPLPATSLSAAVAGA